MTSAHNTPSALSRREAVSHSKAKLLERVSVFFRNQSSGWLMAETLALVVIVGFLDFLTGYEVAFFPFYAIPILLTVWFGSRNAAFTVSALSALAWLLADL